MHPHRFSTGPVTLAIVGAGSRGHAYARFATTHPGRARVVAVAEPRQQWRDSLVSAHAVAPMGQLHQQRVHIVAHGGRRRGLNASPQRA